MFRSVCAVVASAVLAVFAVDPASAQHAAFTDPVGDGPSGRYAGLDLVRYHVEYNDERVRVTLRFRNLTAFNFDDIVWYVNRSDRAEGKLGVAITAGGHVRRDIGERACPAATARFNRGTELAVLVAPARCVNNAGAVRVLVGAEGDRGEDWNRSFSGRVRR